MNLRLTSYLASLPFFYLRIEYFAIDAFHGSVEINFLVYESPRDRVYVCVHVLYSLTNSAKVSVYFLSFPSPRKGRKNRK